MIIEKMTIVNGIKKKGRVTKCCLSTSTISTYRNKPHPHPHDILCVQGGGAILEHQGNYNLIVMVQREMEKYFSTGKKSDKTTIIKNILVNISNLKPAGRFLNKKNKNWFEQDDKFARETIAKIFREQAKQTKTTMVKKGVSLVADVTSSLVTSTLVTSSLVMVVSKDITEPVKSYNDTDDNYNYNYNDNDNDDDYNDDEGDDEGDDDNNDDVDDDDDNIDNEVMDIEEYDRVLFSNMQEHAYLIDEILDGDGLNDLNINWGDHYEWKWEGSFEWNWDGEYDLNYEKINALLNL